MPPLVFTGLLLSLWFYKCCMMVVFQNKIIYMPGVPPFARQEKIHDYAASCRPIVWREERISTADGKDIALCIGHLDEPAHLGQDKRPQVVVLYFQG